jgi:hypothetical protein
MRICIDFLIIFCERDILKPTEMIKHLFCLISSGLTLLLLPVEIHAQTEEGWHASKQIVEKLSEKKTGFNYYEDKVPAYKLPDMFISESGIKITSADAWNKIRRPEVLELFRKNVYGRVPETEYKKKFTVVKTDKSALDGKATQKDVEVTIDASGKSLTFNLTLLTPNDSKKPVPVFLLIDPWLADATGFRFKLKDEYWPVEAAISRGYGMAIFDASQLDPDNFDNFKNGIHGLLDKNPRSDDAWGTIAAWAWGASRCMDYLITDKDVAKEKVAIVGHSRAGKTALWAGAEDTRFAMVFSNESGAGGAALSRRRLGETVARINTAFPHWFSTNYKKYNNNEDALPVDMHMLLALIAPRALYIDCADQDLWGDPRGSYLSLYYSVPVFKLLGYTSDIPETMPPLNKQVISGNVGFHIRDGVHNLLLKDWNWFMDFADAVLK